MRRECTRPILALLVLAAASRAQDSLQLLDGRIVPDKKMTRNKDGVTVHYTHGDVLVPNALIHSSTARDESGQAAELSAEAKEQLAKGLVFHENRWVKKEYRDQQIEKSRAARRAKIAEAKKHREWKDRYIERTANFEFEFTIDPEKMREYMDLMETYYKVFTKEWNIRKPPKMGRLKVCFYHDEEYYYQVSGAQRGAIGYFRFVEPIELNFFYDRMDEELTLDVMFHEANHFLTHLIDPKFRYPAWVNESLAEFYGASEWDPKSKTMKTGGLQEGRLAVIQDIIGAANVSQKTASADEGEGKWLGLEEMIRIERFQAVHYAWGWSFVHFLLTNKDYASRFRKDYVDLARSKDIKKALALGGYNMRTVEPDEQIKWLLSYLKVDSLKTLQEEWYRHILSLKPATARGYHRAGEFALWRGMPIKAQRLFGKAIEMGSKTPMTWIGLGEAQAAKGKHAEALESFEKAIQADPLTPMFYVYKGRALSRSDGDKQTARRLFELAREMDPEDVEVWSAVTMALLDHDDEEKGEGDGK